MGKKSWETSNQGQQTLLLVEPHPIIAYAIQQLLKGYPSVQKVVEVENGLKALSAFRQHQPHLTILSSELPGLSMEDVVLQILQRDKEAKLVIYASSSEIPSLQKLLQAGVKGLVLKSQPPQHLLEAVSRVLAHKSYIDASLQPSEKGKSSWLSQKRHLELPHLSPRERQILKLVAEGLKNREISSSFSISIKTVETHRLNLMRKLDAHHVVDLVRWAKRYQLVAC